MSWSLIILVKSKSSSIQIPLRLSWPIIRLPEQQESSVTQRTLLRHIILLLARGTQELMKWHFSGTLFCCWHAGRRSWWSEYAYGVRCVYAKTNELRTLNEQLPAAYAVTPSSPLTQHLGPHFCIAGLEWALFSLSEEGTKYICPRFRENMRFSHFPSVNTGDGVYTSSSFLGKSAISPKYSK